MELNEEDRAVLAFEGSWWIDGGVKTSRIRDELGMSSARYYKRLAALIESSAALEFDPMLIRRLRKRRLVDDGLGSAGEGPQR